MLESEAFCRKRFSLWTAAASYVFPHTHLVDVLVLVLVLLEVLYVVEEGAAKEK
jgi:hypothetical protein